MKGKRGGFSILEVTVIIAMCVLIVQVMLYQLKNMSKKLVDQSARSSSEKLLMSIEQLLADKESCSKSLYGKMSGDDITILSGASSFEVGKRYLENKVQLEQMSVLQVTKEKHFSVSLEVVVKLLNKEELLTAPTTKKKFPLLVQMDQDKISSCVLDGKEFDVKGVVSSAVCGYFGGVPDKSSGRCMTLEIPIDKIKLCHPGDRGSSGVQDCKNPTLSLEEYIEEKTDILLRAEGFLLPTPLPSTSSAP